MQKSGVLGGVVWGLLLTGWIVPAKADRMVLDNGEVLVGTLVEIAQEQVTFESEYLTRVTVPGKAIESLVTEEKLQLCLGHGEILEESLVTSDAGTGVAINQGGAIRLIGFDEIVTIHPDAMGEAEDVAEGGHAETSDSEPQDQITLAPWTGSLDGGLTSVHGNKSTRSYSGSLKLDRRLEKIKASISADYARATQKDLDTKRRSLNEDWWKTYGKLSYYFTKKNYSYVDGRYEIDSVANLKHRVTLGAGAGYQFVESDQVKISVDLGGASLREEYEPDSDRDNSELSLQMGYDVGLKINDHLKLMHDITYYPNGRKFSDYYLTSTTEIRQQLTEKLFANMKGIFNYDAFAASGTLSTDIKYIFGVGLNF